jgi:hypothetical protein
MDNHELRLTQIFGKYYCTNTGLVLKKLRYPKRVNKSEDRAVPKNYLQVDGDWYFILTPRLRGTGYYCLELANPTYLVHELIAEAFIPNPNGYKYVRHIDYDTNNNDVSNLEWVDGNQVKGNGFGKREKIDYQKMRTLLETSLSTQKEIAEECCCSIGTVEMFVRVNKVQRPSNYVRSRKIVHKETTSEAGGTCKDGTCPMK